MKFKTFSVLTFMIVLMMNSSVSGYALSGGYTNLSGQEISYSTYEGSYVFLEAFATTCGYCKQQHPIINQLNSAYGSDVVFLSIAVFPASDSVETVTKFVEEFETNWLIGVDDGELQNNLGITSTPTMFLMDKAGIVIQKFVGLTSYEDISYYIEVNVKGNTASTLVSPTSNSIDAKNNDASVFSNLLGSPVFKAVSVFVIITVIYVKSTGKK